MGVVEVEQARTAFDRGDWDVAFEGWSAVGADALTAAELEDLATAAELLGRHDDVVRALQQAFTRHQQAGDLAAAVRCAFRLAMTTAAHGEPAMSAGWTSRAEGLVAELGDVPRARLGRVPADVPRPRHRRVRRGRRCGRRGHRHRTPPPRPGPDRPGPVLAGAPRALRGPGRGRPRAASTRPWCA